MCHDITGPTKRFSILDTHKWVPKYCPPCDGSLATNPPSLCYVDLLFHGKHHFLIDVATICKAQLYPSFSTSSSFTMFPEFRRGQRNSSVSAPSSFTAMATVASDSDPEGVGHCNPSKLWTIGALLILPLCKKAEKFPQKITTLTAPAAWKIFKVCKNISSVIWIQRIWGFHHCLQIRDWIFVRKPNIFYDFLSLYLLGFCWFSA